MENGFFERMCKEAQDDLADGKMGWREAPPNTLIMACFGMLSNHLTSKIAKPMWFFAGTAFAGVIGYFVALALGAF